MKSLTRDETMMWEALRLAAKGRGFTSPNPMVGAVAVQAGGIAGIGYHESVGGPHAEINCLRDAGEKARGATLYVTLEPCNHYGRTPPCTQAIVQAGLSRVVAGMCDPNPQVAGGGIDFLRSRGIEVEAESRLEDLYKEFNPAVDEKLFEALMEMFDKGEDEKYISPDLKQKAVAAGGYVQLADQLYGASMLDEGEKILSGL